MRLCTLSTLFAAFLLISARSVAHGDSCITAACHQSVVGVKNLHQPVKDGDCTTCHQQKAKEHPVKGVKSFQLAEQGAALCSQCHEAKGKKKVVHPPVKDGDCLACHKPHGAAGRFLLDSSDNLTELCLGCHDSAPFKNPKNFMHGPAAVGECTKCHDPHESTDSTLLKGRVRDICLKCHADFAAALKAAPVGHPPVKEGPCTSCHTPHGSEINPQLRKGLPILCIECHDHIGNKVTGVKVPHKPLMQEGGCTNCHSAHYSAAKGLLSSDEMSVCLACHDKDNLGTPPLRNIKRDLADKKFLHGPIRQRECKPCHDPHGSDFFRMLRGTYPSTLYVPYRDGLYDACLGCHDKNLISARETSSATKFRNGSRNLHNVHVGNRNKGRTCRICHAPHASSGVKLIDKESLKFGEWDIPINFQIGANGGRCAPGCHKAFSYDREKPVTY